MYAPEGIDTGVISRAKSMATEYIDEPEFLAFAHKTGHLIQILSEDNSTVIWLHLFTPYARMLDKLHRDMKQKQREEQNRFTITGDTSITEASEDELVLLPGMFSKYPIRAEDLWLEFHLPESGETIQPREIRQSDSGPISDSDHDYCFAAVVEYVFLIHDFPMVNGKADYEVVAVFTHATGETIDVIAKTTIDLSQID
jgi:hypothetical protein